jgi:hypothetical protein
VCTGDDVLLVLSDYVCVFNPHRWQSPPGGSRGPHTGLQDPLQPFLLAARAERGHAQETSHALQAHVETRKVSDLLYILCDLFICVRKEGTVCVCVLFVDDYTNQAKDQLSCVKNNYAATIIVNETNEQTLPSVNLPSVLFISL